MIIEPQAVIPYAEFLGIVQAIGSVRAVFYFDDTAVSGNFTIVVLMADGHVGIRHNEVGVTPPATFATDFPNAIACSAVYALR